MPEMLRDPDSTEKHLSVVRRHMRLCRAVKGAEFLREAIEPAHQKLSATLVTKKKAVEAEEDAQDDLEMRGREAADLLRTTSERAKQYDREAPGEAVFGQLFPEGGYGASLAKNGTVSPGTSRVFAARIRGLGAGHALHSVAAEHDAKAAAIEEAEKIVADALRARKLAEAEDELAQAALRKAYENNSLDARKKFGKAAAERLFPRIRKRAAEDEDGAAEGTSAEGAG